MADTPNPPASIVGKQKSSITEHSQCDWPTVDFLEFLESDEASHEVLNLGGRLTTHERNGCDAVSTEFRSDSTNHARRDLDQQRQDLLFSFVPAKARRLRD